MSDPNIHVTLTNAVNHTGWIWHTGMFRHPYVLAMLTLYREDKPVHFHLDLWNTSCTVTVIICHKTRRDLLSAWKDIVYKSRTDLDSSRMWSTATKRFQFSAVQIWTLNLRICRPEPWEADVKSSLSFLTDAIFFDLLCYMMVSALLLRGKWLIPCVIFSVLKRRFVPDQDLVFPSSWKSIKTYKNPNRFNWIIWLHSFQKDFFHL